MLAIFNPYSLLPFDSLSYTSEAIALSIVNLLSQESSVFAENSIMGGSPGEISEELVT